jgi:hypothetical protein
MAGTPRPTRFYFLTTFWGERFRDYWCRFTLPSLLAPGNLPSLRHKGDARFIVVTTKEDLHALQKERVFAQLREHIEVEVLWGDDEGAAVHKYRRMAQGLRMLADACFEDKAFAVSIPPDSLFPDGCVAEAQRLALDERHDVVLCPAIRFDMDGIEAELSRAGALAPGRTLAISMREAVALGLRHLHPESLAADWNAPNFARLHRDHERRYFLTCCYWRVPGEDGLCIVTHNWSPFVVNYAALGSHDSSMLDGQAIDGEYIFRNFPAYTDAIHVVRDSDRLFLLGLTPRAEMAPSNERAWFTRLGGLGEAIKGLVLSGTVLDKGVDEYRRMLYTQYARWHAHDLNDSWMPVERDVRRIIDTYVVPSAGELGARQGLRSIGLRSLWHGLVRPLIL